AMVALLGVILAMILPVTLPLELAAIPPFALTMVGLFGFGYAIGGLTLVFKQISSVSGLLTNVLLFLNGALLPVHHFPAWLETIAVFLPTTQGIIVLRKVVVDGASLTAVWEDGSMVFLAVQSILFLVVGWALFNVGERVAKRSGTLGQY
ncbi:MAG: ABC transporter permease, partial [Chloroflexota bacterium]|nr:ABC transporter permease [Chloroflexota bacterium]